MLFRPATFIPMRTSRDQRSLPVCFCGVLVVIPPLPPPSLRAGGIDLGIIIVHKPQPGTRAGRTGRPNPSKDLIRHTKVRKLTFYSSTMCRQYLFISTPFDMGIHVRSTSAERVPAMACLRLPNGRPPLGVDGDGERGNRAQSDLLRFTSPHDDSKCRA